MPKEIHKKWTEEENEEFRAMYAKGATHSEIGRHFGVSRNASIGKAHRLGLEGRVKVGTGRTARKRKPKQMKVVDTAPVVYKSKAEKNRDLAVERAEQGARELREINEKKFESPYIACFECMEFETMCAWPIRSNPTQYCGAPIKRRASYCEKHRRAKGK